MSYPRRKIYMNSAARTSNLVGIKMARHRAEN
jgi:hypothetical protein